MPKPCNKLNSNVINLHRFFFFHPSMSTSNKLHVIKWLLRRLKRLSISIVRWNVVVINLNRFFCILHEMWISKLILYSMQNRKKTARKAPNNLSVNFNCFKGSPIIYELLVCCVTIDTNSISIFIVRLLEGGEFKVCQWFLH